MEYRHLAHLQTSSPLLGRNSSLGASISNLNDPHPSFDTSLTCASSIAKPMAPAPNRGALAVILEGQSRARWPISWQLKHLPDARCSSFSLGDSWFEMLPFSCDCFCESLRCFREYLGRSFIFLVCLPFDCLLCLCWSRLCEGSGAWTAADRTLEWFVSFLSAHCCSS